jgi:Lar family restriction alleviation protein
MTETTAPDALLPCPFCGGAAYTVSTNDERMWFAGCRDCYCNVGESYDRSAMPEHMFSSEEEAIAAWNRRAGQAHAARLLAALEGLVDALAANDEDGMTEFADVMVNARRAIAAAKGGRDAG